MPFPWSSRLQTELSVSGSAVLLCGTGREAGAAGAAVVRSCSCPICAEVQTADQEAGEQDPHHTPVTRGLFGKLNQACYL